MAFLIVTDVFSKYFLVRKLANSTSAAICAELATIVTELGLPTSSEVTMDHATIPRNSSSLCNVTTSHTSSPHHPRSNGFIKKMVGVAKKLMDKAGKEGNCGSQVCMNTESHHNQEALLHHCSS